MKRTNLRARVIVPGILTFLLPVYVLLGCSAPLAGVLAEGKALQAACPSGQMIASDVRVDASSTFVAGEVSGDFEALLRDEAARTAVCGGHLRVSAFAGSSAGTVTLFDEELGLPGATENARFRRIPGVQDHVVDEVSKNYGQFDGMAGGSDIVGQFRLADEYVRQLGEQYVLNLVAYTDGLQNAGVDVGAARDAAEAEQMAQELAVPDLYGANVTIVGLGNRNGVKPSSRQTEVLVAYYEALCVRMNADRCLAATEYVAKSGR